MDKTWIQPYTPESHQGSKRLDKGRAITGGYYAALLDRLVDGIRKKLPRLKKKKILFLHDNAASRTLNNVHSKKHELSFKLLLHPPYSPDLVPQRQLSIPKPQEIAVW